MAYNLSLILRKGNFKNVLQDKLFINAAFLFLITVVNSLGGFLFWTLAARSTPSSNIGVASSVITTSVLISTLSGLGLGLGFIRFFRESENPNGLFVVLFGITLTSSGIISLLFLYFLQILAPSIHPYFTSYGNYIYFITLTIMISFTNLLLNVFTGYRSAIFGFIQVAVMNIIRIAFLLTENVRGNLGIAKITTLAFFFSTMFGLVIFAVKLSVANSSGQRTNRGLMCQLISYSLVNQVASVFINLPIVIFPILILRMLGESSSAYSYIAWTISLLIAAPGIALGSSALSECVNAPEKTHTILRRSLVYSILITVPLAIIIGVCAPLILSLFGKEYAEFSTQLLRVLSITSIFVGINGIFYSYFRIKSMYVEIILTSFIMCFISLFFTITMASDLGISSSGIGYLIAQLSVLLITAIIVYRKEGKI
jgi:O-antigen/teichoic acid export membrane protein